MANHHVIKERYRRAALAEPGARVRPVFDDFHRLRMTGDYEYPGHRHANHELILVECGPYRCTLNRAELTLASGQVLLVKPGDWHQDHLRQGQRHYVLHFHLPAVGGGVVELFRPEVRPEEQVCRRNQRRETLFLEELKREAVAGQAYAPTVQDGLLEALFWRIVRALPVAGLSAEIRRLPREERVRERLATTLERHLAGNPTVRELAAELGMSPRHFTHQCRRLLGETPARLLLGWKLRHAEGLLRGGVLRVKEVSDQLGFVNPYHFSRVFRRQFGRPPSRLEGPSGDRGCGRARGLPRTGADARSRRSSPLCP